MRSMSEAAMEKKVPTKIKHEEGKENIESNLQIKSSQGKDSGIDKWSLFGGGFV